MKALYFGAWSSEQLGHYLHRPNGITVSTRDLPGFPWNEGLMDTGLLKNGEHKDIVDGKVFWTCGGRDINCLWHAFFWWDRSGDRRGNSNSGFYTYGFPGRGGEVDAFAFACGVFAGVVKRQRMPLELQA